MGLRHFSEDVGTAARLSSAAVAHAALADGNERALPFRDMAEVEARTSLNRLWEAWPSIKGLSNCLDESVHWARLTIDGTMLRMAASCPGKQLGACTKLFPALILMTVLQPSLSHLK